MSSSRQHTRFEQCVSKYAGGLKAYLRQRLGSDEDAEDALQDILYNLFRTAGNDLESIVNLPAWLYRSARNLIFNISRKKTMENFDDNDLIIEILADNDSDQESQMLSQIFWQELEMALDGLPEPQRRVWELSELNGMSIKEISESTGAAQATVLSRKHYAVKHLRKRMQRLYDDIINKP